MFGCEGIVPRALSEESAVGKIIKGLAGFSEAFGSKSKCLIGFLCANSSNSKTYLYIARGPRMLHAFRQIFVLRKSQEG